MAFSQRCAGSKKTKDVRQAIAVVKVLYLIVVDAATSGHSFNQPFRVRCAQLFSSSLTMTLATTSSDSHSSASYQPSYTSSIDEIDRAAIERFGWLAINIHDSRWSPDNDDILYNFDNAWSAWKKRSTWNKGNIGTAMRTYMTDIFASDDYKTEMYQSSDISIPNTLYTPSEYITDSESLSEYTPSEYTTDSERHPSPKTHKAVPALGRTPQSELPNIQRCKQRVKKRKVVQVGYGSEDLGEIDKNDAGSYITPSKDGNRILKRRRGADEGVSLKKTKIISSTAGSNECRLYNIDEWEYSGLEELSAIAGPMAIVPATSI
ncbi:hypothetical protein Q9L58_010639, partial [Maublancomyces gigas]